MAVPDVTPDLPSPGWRAVLALLERLPQASLSRGLGGLADLRIPKPLRRPILSTFARSVGIDVSEAELPLAAYPSVNAFFVRKLKDGLRSWPGGDDTLASPVDGVVGQIGTVTEDRVVQAKGRSYSAAALLGRPEEGARYEGGTFITIYLSPRHYHRIHTPTPGRIPLARHVPGALLPVNQPAVNHVEELFPRNERLVCYVDGPLGRVAVVAVGAYNVGRISTAFDTAWSGREGGWITNRSAPPPPEKRYDPPLPVERGEEIMAFHLGSTVVLLMEPPELAIEPGCSPGKEVRLGDVIARRSDGAGVLSRRRPPRGKAGEEEGWR